MGALPVSHVVQGRDQVAVPAGLGCLRASGHKWQAWCIEIFSALGVREQYVILGAFEPHKAEELSGLCIIFSLEPEKKPYRGAIFTAVRI